MSIFFIYNGGFYEEGISVITPDNHSFRYGDGLFETLRAHAGKLLLDHYHFDRLFYGLNILGFDVPQTFTPAFLTQEIMRVLKKNKHEEFARIRLNIFRGNGSLSNPENHYPNYIIQTFSLDEGKIFNKEGLLLDLCKTGRKSCDSLANLKTNNFLLYTLAAINAKKNKLHDCIVLNSNERICDTSVANIFMIKDKKIFTPPLSEGCIAGVMRRWLLEKVKMEGSHIIEKPLSVADLKQADEIFLTNSIHPVRWVKQFQDIQYTNHKVKAVYDELSKTF